MAFLRGDGKLEKRRTLLWWHYFGLFVESLNRIHSIREIHRTFAIDLSLPT